MSAALERVAIALAERDGWKGDSLFPDADWQSGNGSAESLREEYREEARSVLGQPGPQPIETAPRDGTEVLVLVGRSWFVSRWSRPWLNGAPNPNYPEGWEPHMDAQPWAPTHWHPLPEIPT